MVPSLYTIWGTERLGIGIATKCDTGSFAGVWAAEVVLDSVRLETVRCHTVLTLTADGLMIDHSPHID